MQISEENGLWVLEQSELHPIFIFKSVLAHCLHYISKIFEHIFEGGKLTSLTNAMILKPF